MVGLLGVAVGRTDGWPTERENGGCEIGNFHLQPYVRGRQQRRVNTKLIRNRNRTRLCARGAALIYPSPSPSPPAPQPVVFTCMGWEGMGFCLHSSSIPSSSSNVK